MSKKLPQGWVNAKLDEVADALDYEREPINSSERSKRVSGKLKEQLFAYYGATGQVGLIDDFRSDGERVLLGEDGAPFLDSSKDKAYLVSGKFWVNNHAHVLQGAAGYVSNRFLCHQLNTVDYQQFVAGSTRLKLTSAAMKQIPLCVAPAAEQTRIVEKLEELLSGLDAGVAELKAAQKKLTQYRQSLLKAAVEGALTADWRAVQGSGQPAGSAKSAESGQALLARILTERRSRWQARQLAKFKAQGKTPPRDWQAKYPEPVAPDTAGLPALPQGWVWASLDQVVCELRSGTSATSGRDETNYPILKSSAVRQGHINFDALNYLQENQSARQENYLEIGDVLITRLSGSVEYVGCCAVVNELPASGIQYPDRVFCGKLAPSLMWLADFLVCCFHSAYVRKRVESAAKSSAGHKRISLSDLHPMPIPIPPSTEITVILAQIDEAFQRIRGGERDVGISLKQSAAQRKNILKAAFSGQLVPQDPADELANALLARIRVERAAREAGSRGRGKKKGMA